MRLVCFWLFLCLGIVFGGWLIHLEGIWRGLAYFWIGFMLILNMVGILVEFKERRWLLDRFYSRRILTKNIKNMEKLNTKWSRKYFNYSWWTSEGMVQTPFSNRFGRWGDDHQHDVYGYQNIDIFYHWQVRNCFWFSSWRGGKRSRGCEGIKKDDTFFWSLNLGSYFLCRIIVGIYCFY